jgi:hypothetical protein
MKPVLILESQLRAFSFCETEDEAALAIQNILGVTDGGIAGIVFSGFDWGQASIEERQDKLREYVRIECRNDDDDDARCTCRTPIATSADVDPPEYKSIRNPWCPVHGKDPDEAYEEMRDREEHRYENWDEDWD